MRRKVVYVLVARSGRVNDRIEKLAGLGARYEQLTLVTKGTAPVSQSHLAIRPIPNPTNVLRSLGLTKIRKAIDRLLYFPSPEILFVVRCLPALRKRIRADLALGRDVCLVTCVPPHDVVIAGLALKRQFPSLRWLIDWQDLWSYDENYFNRTPAWCKGKLLRIERQALDLADVNVVTNAHARDVLIERYDVPHAKVIAIHHHFSKGDLTQAAAIAPHRLRRPGAMISIGFLGSLFKPPRVPGSRIVDTIQRLRSAGIPVELHVYGTVPLTLRASVADLRSKGIHLHGSLAHREAIRRIAQHEFLLLVLADLPNSRAVMSIKLPHYLLTGRTIIAIAPEPSAVASVIHTTGSGIVIPADSDWFVRLREILTDTSWISDLVRNEQCIETYSWDAVARDWMDVIDSEARRIDHESV